MRRLLSYFGIVTCLVVSCSTRDKDFQTPVQEDVIYYATFEQPAEDGTRVYANEDLLLRWTADDRVSIFGKNTYNQQYRFIGETGDNSGGFSKVDGAEYVTGNPISHTVSIYPYQASTKITEDEVLTVTLPAEQHYAENTFGLGANTMVSISEDNFLQYKNVGGYLRISLYGEGVSVSSITLKGNNGEKLAGRASVTMPLDGVPAIALSSDATDEITLVCNTPVELGAAADESVDFWFVVPPVTFSQGFTISVTQTTGGVYRKATSNIITIERNRLSKMSLVEVDFLLPETIDLGLSVKWSPCNLGASRPDESGYYYTWGDIEPIVSYPSSYKWMDESSHLLTKYNTNASNGIVDNKIILELEDDAAFVSFGGKWRMPTFDDFKELINPDNCTWTWTSFLGKNGYLVTSKITGNSIFLPVTGGWINGGFYDGPSGYYWSSSLLTLSGETLCAYVLGFSNNPGYASMIEAWRYNGYTIRPVYDESTIPVESISLDKTELELFVAESSALSASVFPDNATYKNVCWSSNDESVATVSSSGIVEAVSGGTAVIMASAGGQVATCQVVVNSIPPIIGQTPIVAAFFTEYTEELPDATLLTHINYAHGHFVNPQTGDGGIVITESKQAPISKVVALKSVNPNLKVILSIGGWGADADGFSEMAKNEVKRTEFCQSVKSLLDLHHLDGVDIDWEYPTVSADGETGCDPMDTQNFNLVLQELRETLGVSKIISLESSSAGKYIDWNTAIKYIDYVNVMTYDMGAAPNGHNSPLHKSNRFTHRSWDEAVDAHVKAGVPKDRLVMGIPFYGKAEKNPSEGTKIFDYVVKYYEIPDILEKGVYKGKALARPVTRLWDATAMVPFLVDASGKNVLSYDDPESVAAKGAYVLANELLGAMCKEYRYDSTDHDLLNSLVLALYGKQGIVSQ